MLVNGGDLVLMRLRGRQHCYTMPLLSDQEPEKKLFKQFKFCIKFEEAETDL
jgi:hypothetical protein